MRRSHLVLLIAPMSFVRAFAGDDASGPVHYRADFSKPFTTYVMSENDKQWSRSLIRNLKYTGNVVHFVKTSLTLEVDGSKIEHAIYQAVEKPDLFYVINGDAMLQMGTRWPFNPGVAGFSMHAPKSRDFIVSVYLSSGVPFLSSSPVQKGPVDWKGQDWTRFK